MSYQRRTVWASQSPLTAADLNSEFDAIQAAIAGLAADVGAIGSLPIINAGDAAYNPTGTGSNAARVSDAIQAAVGSQVKVVWVPKFMWGYIQDPEWSAEMFDTTVLVVREGALNSAYDPVAYGAKLDDATVNDRPAFAVIVAHAAAATGPGAKRIAVTIPGSYQINTDIAIPDDVAFEQWSGIEYGGAGNVTGLGHPYAFVSAETSGSVNAESDGLASVSLNLDPKEWIPIMFRVARGSGTNQWDYFHQSYFQAAAESPGPAGLQSHIRLIGFPGSDEFAAFIQFYNWDVVSRSYNMRFELLAQRRPPNFELLDVFNA